MLKTRLFCTISIFLCALFSSRAQDWETLAVGYERIIFEGADLHEVNEALAAKAECYKRLGRYEDASATLLRIRMFALSPEERQAVLFQRELCYFLGGDFRQAAALAEEVEEESREILMLHALALAYAGSYDESEIYAARCISYDGESPYLQELLDLYASHPPIRRHGTAMALAFIPPLGHIYNAAPGEGVLSAGLNAAAAAFTVASLLGGYWISGIVGGGIALNYTFMGNQQRNSALVDINNNNSAVLFGESLREFFRKAL